VTLYEANSDGAKAAEWRTKLEAIDGNESDADNAGANDD